jgi:hypothetical protein
MLTFSHNTDRFGRMGELGGYKRNQGCHAPRVSTEDAPDYLPPVLDRFAHDANLLTEYFERQNRPDLITTLHNVALSYGSGYVNEDPNAFQAGTPIRVFLEAATPLFPEGPPDPELHIALTHFIGALCRLSPDWIAFFSDTEPFFSALADWLLAPVPALSLNVLRIHRWIWKNDIRRNVDFDVGVIVHTLGAIPERQLDHGIETALVLRTLIAALPTADPRLSPMPALLCGLLEAFPCWEILGPVGGAGTQLICQGGAPHLVADEGFLTLFLKLLNRAAVTSGDQFPVDAFGFICQLVTSMDPGGRTAVFSRVLPMTHMAMLTHCGPEATESYLTAAAELVLTASDVCTLLEDPIYFDFMRLQVIGHAFVRQNAWLKFCLALIARRGPHVLELLVTRGEVIKELSVAADAEDVCEDYVHMIARLLEARLAMPGLPDLDGAIADQIRAAIEDEDVGGLLMGFATSEDVPEEWGISDMASVRQLLLALLQ